MFQNAKSYNNGDVQLKWNTIFGTPYTLTFDPINTFSGASAYNQNMIAWSFSGPKSFAGTFDNTGLDIGLPQITNNYDNLLTTLSNQNKLGLLNPGIKLGVNNLHYHNIVERLDVENKNSLGWLLNTDYKDLRIVPDGIVDGTKKLVNTREIFDVQNQIDTFISGTNFNSYISYQNMNVTPNYYDNSYNIVLGKLEGDKTKVNKVETVMVNYNENAALSDPWIDQYKFKVEFWYPITNDQNDIVDNTLTHEYDISDPINSSKFTAPEYLFLTTPIHTYFNR